jgi:hypothetical protein
VLSKIGEQVPTKSRTITAGSLTIEHTTNKKSYRSFRSKLWIFASTLVGTSTRFDHPIPIGCVTPDSLLPHASDSFEKINLGRNYKYKALYEKMYHMDSIILQLCVFWTKIAKNVHKGCKRMRKDGEGWGRMGKGQKESLSKRQKRLKES